MASNAQKTSLARSLERFAQRKVEAALDLLGQALPASVVTVHSSGIVTVKFELTNVPFTLPQIKVPILGSEYVRLPIQAGMKGMVIAADAYLGGMSGLGGGTADLTPRPNLSNLAFVPLGSTGWSPTEDPNALVLYGPNGVVIRDEGKQAMLTLTPSGIDVALLAALAEFFISQGNFHAAHNAEIDGDAMVGGALDVAGKVTAAGALEVAGTFTADGEADIAGPLVLAGGTTIKRILSAKLTTALGVLGPFATAIATPIACPGAKVGDNVLVTPSLGGAANIVLDAWVSAADQLTLVFYNARNSAGGAVPSQDYNFLVIGHTP